MNPVKLASRLHFMATQLRGEAQRQEGDVRKELQRGARQCAIAFRMAYSPDPERRAVADSILEGATDYLVGVIAARTERELMKGIPE